MPASQHLLRRETLSLLLSPPGRPHPSAFLLQSSVNHSTLKRKGAILRSAVTKGSSRLEAAPTDLRTFHGFRVPHGGVSNCCEKFLRVGSIAFHGFRVPRRGVKSCYGNSRMEAGTSSLSVWANFWLQGIRRNVKNYP